MVLISKLVGKVRKEYPLLLLICVFLAVRLIDLTKLPIFNDESIYLDWGWRELTTPGMLFYSLYDGKQPLFMWIFGIAELIGKDPIVSGRIVTVLCGLVSLVGLYKVGSKYLNRTVGIVSAGIYIIVPYFSFYDRQALMESAVAAVGIWFVYFSLSFFKDSTRKLAIILGIIAGIGLFVKTSFSIFLITFAIYAIFFILREDIQKKRSIKLFGVMTLVMGLVDLLLIIQPLFWETLSSNSRYTLSISEIIKTFPIHLIHNLIGNSEILLVFFSPFFIVLSLIGFYYLWKENKKRFLLLFTFFVFVPIFIESLTTITVSQRYLVSLTPLLIIPAAFVTDRAMKKRNVLILALFTLGASYCIVLTILQVTRPIKYFDILSKIFPYSDKSAYVLGQTSGYGVPDVVSYIQNVSRNQTVYVGVALNTGNPESAMMTYFHDDGHVKVIYFDRQLFTVDLTNYNCFSSQTPVYFVSRNDELAGLNKMLVLQKRFYKPSQKSWIGVYTLKHCVDKPFHLMIGRV